MFMESDEIIKIWIDDSSKICVQPKTQTFDYIYRAAMGVRWNAPERFLYPYLIRHSVGSWTPIDWFRQIILAAKDEYGCRLYITKDTIWDNVESTIKNSIEEEHSNSSMF